MSSISNGRNRRRILHAACFLLLAAVATEAAACPVCWGSSDAQIVKGVEMSVLFLGLLTYVVILGGLGTFIVLRRRALASLEDTSRNDANHGVDSTIDSPVQG